MAAAIAKDAKYTARENFAENRIAHSDDRTGKWPAPRHIPAPGKIVAEDGVRFRAMSARFGGALLGFMRTMHLARRKSQRQKKKAARHVRQAAFLLQ